MSPGRGTRDERLGRPGEIPSTERVVRRLLAATSGRRIILDDQTEALPDGGYPGVDMYSVRPTRVAVDGATGAMTGPARQSVAGCCRVHCEMTIPHDWVAAK